VHELELITPSVIGFEIWHAPQAIDLTTTLFYSRNSRAESRPPESCRARQIFETGAYLSTFTSGRSIALAVREHVPAVAPAEEFKFVF
jgi:hypothetical protein